MLPGKGKKMVWRVSVRFLHRKKTSTTGRSFWAQTNQEKKKIGMFAVFVSVLMGTVELTAAPAQVLPLETFEESALLAFPAQWQVQGDAKAARKIYRVMAESDNRFLHADASHQAIQIGLVYGFSPHEFSLLRWRWRVFQLPPGGDESRKETHDSAAGVYVIFDNTIFPRIIKYVWSTILPVGTRVPNPLYGRAKIVVLESGDSGSGQWRQETVDFAQDYRTLFGQEPGQVKGIGVASSSSFTKSRVIADYDDFMLLNVEAWRAKNTPEVTTQQQPGADKGQ